MRRLLLYQKSMRLNVKVPDYLPGVNEFDPQKIDFNDHHLLATAKENGAVLITNDKDFYGEKI
jgi:predicted nucleic acid-binding protein